MPWGISWGSPWHSPDQTIQKLSAFSSARSASPRFVEPEVSLLPSRSTLPFRKNAGLEVAVGAAGLQHEPDRDNRPREQPKCEGTGDGLQRQFFHIVGAEPRHWRGKGQAER